MIPLLLLFATVVAKLVDLLRDSFDPDLRAPRFVWNLCAFALGLGVAYAWDVHVPLPAAVHATHVAPTILAGLVIGGGSDVAHKFLDVSSGAARALHAHAAATFPHVGRKRTGR